MGQKDVSELIELPPEFDEFFSQKLGNTMLIKGKPGTGKTSLALSILKKVCKKGNGIYLSTRVDSMILYKLFPWIKGTIMDDFIVDAVQPKLSAMRRETRDVAEIVREIEYSDKPTFIRQLYNLTYKLKDPFLVIDSWDAIELFSKSKYGEGLTEEMIEFARKTDVKIIFVTEYYEQRRLDYLTDAVINMEKEVLDGKTIRILQIEKMRGVEISRDRYLFTLKNGVFRYLKPLSLPSFRIKEGESDDKLFRVVEELEGWMGGEITPKLVLVEYDAHTHRELPLSVLSPLLRRVAQSRRVGVALSESLGVSSIKSVGRAPIQITSEELIGDEELIEKVKEEKFSFEVLFLIYPSGHRIVETLSSYADIHLIFRTINGTPLFRSVKPDSSFYYLEFDERGFNGFVKLV